jgi:hypothetical protein
MEILNSYMSQAGRMRDKWSTSFVWKTIQSASFQYQPLPVLHLAPFSAVLNQRMNIFRKTAGFQEEILSKENKYLCHKDPDLVH